MWISSCREVFRFLRFFLLILGHDKLGNVFKTNFSLMQHHHWSISELENMIPWERYIYIDLLEAFLIEQEKLAKQREQEMKAQIRQAQRRKQ